jgi:hypothetical protein
MMKKHFGAAFALTLACCATASAATIPVNRLSGDFAATNPSVVSTNDGVQFGVYPDATTGGSLRYSGANGLALASITDLSYTFIYKADSEPPSYTAAPYLRVFTDGPDHDPLVDDDGDGNPANDAPDLILEPSNCATEPNLDQTVPHTYEMVGYAHLRYADDGCASLPDQSWADIVAAHGAEHVTGIYVTAGFAVGTNISALLTALTVNGNTFCFDCAPVPIVSNTTFVTEPPRLTTAASLAAQSCKGNTVRRLHAPRRPGQRFLSVRATLRGKVLKVNGRTITANLTGQPEANYNVRLTIRYRARSGKIVTVKTTRNLSVVCA